MCVGVDSGGGDLTSVDGVGAGADNILDGDRGHRFVVSGNRDGSQGDVVSCRGSKAGAQDSEERDLRRKMVIIMELDFDSIGTSL